MLDSYAGFHVCKLATVFNLRWDPFAPELLTKGNDVLVPASCCSGLKYFQRNVM